jgi:beta-galactosidase
MRRSCCVKRERKVMVHFLYGVVFTAMLFGQYAFGQSIEQPRSRIPLNTDWFFLKYESIEQADQLQYDIRPPLVTNTENRVADARPTEAVKIESGHEVLKQWILPSANPFIRDIQKHYAQPEDTPGKDFPFVQNDFNDAAWQKVNLPHDWAIQSSFMVGPKPEVGGGMGRLPTPGVAWYRKKISIDKTDLSQKIYLDIDGAMSYAMVWVNGHLAGGWPYGYNSFRIEMTPHLKLGDNQIAIRLDNPNHSSRWYAGGGIYRNVWLVKVNPIHIGYNGTFISTDEVTQASAKINIGINLENKSKQAAQVVVTTRLFTLDDTGKKSIKPVGSFPVAKTMLAANKIDKVNGTLVIKNPQLWGPPPTQKPNLYVAVTTLQVNNKQVDVYETQFGIRTVEFNADKGLIVNGERIQIKGVNQHHDLGALGAAFNLRAAERQLETLREMGCNSIRMAHNPPAPELLDLTDRMGFLVFNEIFDSWELKKTPHDFHLIFLEWLEPDTRNFIRRDRNHPSIIIWGMGNEVGEQYTAEAGAAVAQKIYNIIKEEDNTRPVTAAMNFAKPDMALPKVLDIISLNYQGEGIRQAPEFEGTERIRTIPQYEAYHKQFPGKLILSSETASAFSSRGVYLFPVSTEISAPVRDGRGGDSKTHHVSSYELHAVDFGSSAEKVFGSVERHPFVAGEFVWTGWDHLGEPTPYYDSRSSYCGIIDLAGFKKDRYFLYQAHWRPDLPMAHILPHWNWPDRIGMVTPIHVFTSGDEAELFINGKSQGRKRKAQYQYRLRWDSATYEPGKVEVVAYKNGKRWAEAKVETTTNSARLVADADRNVINSDRNELVFVTVQIADENGKLVPDAGNNIEFTIEGPAEIVATDNGDPTNMESFASTKRNAFNGLCLVIIRAVDGKPGNITVTAKSQNLTEAKVKIVSKAD